MGLKSDDQLIAEPTPALFKRPAVSAPPKRQFLLDANILFLAAQSDGAVRRLTQRLWPPGAG